MIVVPVREEDNIERALRRYKRKFDRTGRMRELRSRQAFVKPSEMKKTKFLSPPNLFRGIKGVSPSCATFVAMRGLLVSEPLKDHRQKISAYH